MKRVLLDTGPLVALLDRSDPDHNRVKDWLPGHRIQLFSTGAVLTEAMFFLQDVPEGPVILSRFVDQASLELLDVFSVPTLSACSQLMQTYADTPMDFADASLVVAASVLKVPDILTFDQRGFRTYRFNRRRAFRLVLQDT